jgi:hypothetical protein
MFDNVNFYIDNGSVENTFSILPYLTDITEKSNARMGYSVSGKLKNYTVNVYENGISLKGSLSKYYLSNNIQTLTRQATARAIEQMSDELHLDLNDAKVTRLDVSTVIPTKQPPQNYYKHLGVKPYYQRLQATADTLYYNTLKQQLIFYDKTKEAAAKGVELPATLSNTNLLRYELRFMKSLSTKLKTDVKGKTLSDEIFYFNLIERWQKEFESIKKITKINVMIENVKTPKEAQTALFSALLQQSGQDVIEGFLADLRAKNTFNDPKYYSILKSDLNRIIQSPKEKKN